MSRGKSYDLLIVDDEEYVCRLLERWVAGEGYTCKTATSGKEALEHLNEDTFLAVITDILMPGVSGIDLLDYIGKHFENTPVILITAMDDNRFIKKAYGLGAYGYISKPLKQNEVLSNIVNALRRRELEQENKQYSEGLKGIIETRTKKIEEALDSISNILKKVVNEQNFDVRFENPEIPECYNVMGCSEVDCPCYDRGNERCWQIAGTYCGSKTQGKFVEKYGSCSQCPVFLRSTSEQVLQIGELFNNMMSLLAAKHYELADSYEQLKTSQQRVIQQEKMATIGQLSAGIAHEINNPVGYVTSNLTSLHKYFEKLKEFIALQSDVIKAYEQGSTPININAEKKRLKINYILEDIEELTKETEDGCDRIRSIIRDLKSFARSNDEQKELMDINEIIDKTINVVWNEIKYKSKVEKKYGDLPKTNCFSNKLSQVFMNLIVNASQAIESEGQITLSTWHENGSIFITVHDNGSGIPAENLENIFMAFFTTKEEGKGTGLGLSICKEIVESHDGEITVASAAGEGTTFTVKLPVA
jgi:signal transduction histidine kinase/DNA-binding response OmpR family regulator